MTALPVEMSSGEGPTAQHIPSDGDLARHHFEAIVQSSDDAIVSKTLDGTIVSWNPGAERIFGYEASEAVGRQITMLIPEDRLAEEMLIIERIRSGDRIAHYETVRQRKDGSLVDISLTVSPIRDANGRIVGASKIARDISERKREQQRRELLLGEMKHRARNFMAIIDGLSRQSAPKASPEAAAALQQFVGRLRALLVTGEIIVDSELRCASLEELFGLTLKPYRDPNRPSQIALGGPPLEVSEQTAGALALAINELATNALKYGALSRPDGRVTLRWTIDQNARVEIEWRENGGPPVAPVPERRGFGSRVIGSAVAAERDGVTRLEFAPEGVRCSFEFLKR